MEKGLPGALTLGVGGSADPRMDNAWVMPVEKGADGKYHGVPEAMRVLDLVAARKKGERPPKPSERLNAEPVESAWERFGAIAMVVALLAAAAVAYWVMIKSFGEVLNAPPPQQYYEDVPPGYDPNFDWNDMFR
jgi:hypothetical protein